MSLRPYLDKLPVLGERVYVDPAATVIGEVELGDDVSVWPGTVIRGDVNFVRIGARTNVQDGTIVHVSHHSPMEMEYSLRREQTLRTSGNTPSADNCDSPSTAEKTVYMFSSLYA